MEKSNSRGRRNAGDSGNSASSGSAATRRADAPEPTRIPPGQKAKRRIEDAATAVIERTNSPAGIADTFADERNDVLAVINELEDQLDRQQEVREGLERELTNSAAKLQDANARVQELEWQTVTLQTRVDALEQVRQVAATLEEELNDATARNQRIKEQLATTEKERARLKHELKSAIKQVDELWTVRKERDSLMSDYKSLTVKVDELERDQREALEERGQLQSELQELQAALETVTTERHQLQMTLRTGEDRIRELVQVQESLSDKIDTLRAEKKNLQVQITHLERENARLVEQRQFYECEVTSLRNQNRTSEAALTSVKKAFSEVRAALTDTRVRAQRRSLDTWPRIGSTLHGISTQHQSTVVNSAEADAATITAGGQDPFDSRTAIDDQQDAPPSRTDAATEARAANEDSKD